MVSEPGGEPNHVIPATMAIWFRGTVASADATAPVASPVTSPAANGSGWNATDVTVAWNWADETGGSGINAASCTTSSVSSGEGTITLTATCKDNAGNTGSASRTVKVDKTAPVLAPTVSPSPIALNGVAVAAANASDALSGIATAVCGAVNTSAIGGGTVSCSATDQAGNTNTATVAYVVSVRASKQAVLAAINAELATASKRDRSELREAAKRLAESLDPRNWVDGNHLALKKGKSVFQDEKQAVQKLGELLKDKKSGVADASLIGWIATLTTIDRALAQIAIDEPGLSSKALAEANKELAKGDSALAKGKPAEAIEHYANAWQKATKKNDESNSHSSDHDD